MEQVCFSLSQDYALIIGGAITSLVSIASILANLVSKESKVGKIINYLAFNIKTDKK